jgi:hypothetical protein
LVAKPRTPAATVTPGKAMCRRIFRAGGVLDGMFPGSP